MNMPIVGYLKETIGFQGYYFFVRQDQDDSTSKRCSLRSVRFLLTLVKNQSKKV